MSFFYVTITKNDDEILKTLQFYRDNISEDQITEEVILWCSNNGYSYDNDNISWDYV